MKKYDFFFILSGNQTEPEVTAALDQIKGLLASEGAQEVSFDSMGKQKLAYAIGQDRFGYLINSTFEIDSSKVATFRDKLKQQPEIIRYSILDLPIGQRPGKYTIKTVLSAEERASLIRERRFAAPQQVVQAVKEEQPKAPQLSAEELDQKLEEILKENPSI